MQTLMKLGYSIIVVGATMLLAGCSRQRSVIYRSSSPSGSIMIELITSSRLPIRPRSAVEVVVTERNRERVLVTWEDNEMYPCFATVGWTRDSRAAIILFRNCWRQSYLGAFDLDNGRAVDPGGLMPILAEEIRSQFMLPKIVRDPIAWAQETEEARISFAHWQEQEGLGSFVRR
jgi:hypothetical protein